MTAITVNVRGTKHVEHTLRKIAPREAERLLKQTVSAVATDVIREAKRHMNFRSVYSTGRMKRGVKKRQRRTRNQTVQMDIMVRGAFYWRFHEYGDGGVPRRAMFGKAINKTRSTLPRRFEQLFMKKLVKRMQRARKAGGAARGGR